MRALQLRTLIPAWVIVSFIGFFPELVSAEENMARNGLVLGGWAGYGQMDVSTDTSSGSSDGTFALGFKGGYAIRSQFVLGLELNGWTLKAYDTNAPSRGESVSNVSVFINYFPYKNLPVYVAGGGGQISYTNNSPEVDGRDHGGSWFVGSGYEYPLSDTFMVVPQLRYSHGNFTGGNFSVFEIALGMTWYSGERQ